MQQKQQRIAKKINQLNLSTDKNNVLTYYYNFQNIHDTLLYCLQPKNRNSFTQTNFLGSKEFSRLKFICDGKFQASKFGCLILRLLYIDTPANMMELILSLKKKKNQTFILYQTLGWLLIDNEQYTRQEILNLLTKINENPNQKKDCLQRNLKLTYSQEQNRRSSIAVFTVPCKRTNIQPFFKANVESFLQTPNNLSKRIIQISKHFSQSLDTKYLFNYILLTYGSICHLQTIQNPYTIKEQKKQQFPIYSREKITLVNSFTLLIQESDSIIKGKKSVKVTMQYFDWSLKQTTTTKFYKLQRKIADQYFNALGSQFVVLINDKIYCLDEKQILGNGGFGTTLQAMALQITNAKTQKQKHKQMITFEYHLSNIAMKTLKESSVQYESKGYKVAQKREQLIHTLLGEIRYYQQQKKTKRFFGFQTQRQLVGFSGLVVMQEIFHIKLENQNQYTNHTNQKTFIAFEQAKGTLSQKKITESLKNHTNRIDLLICIFKQLFEGIYCLHYDINNLYCGLLQKYFKIQDKRQTYTSLDQIINQDQRCGMYHRDIKPSNIVFFFQQRLENITDYSQIRVGLIDFGMAGITNFEKNKTKTNCGSRHYMAPQVRSLQGYNEKVDIWSAGIILYQTFTSCKLFLQNHCDPQRNSIKQNLETMDLRYPDHPLLVQLIRGCLIKDKNLRLNVKEIIEQLHLNKFSILPKKQEQYLRNLYISDKIKSNIVCVKIKHQTKQQPSQVVFDVNLSKKELRTAKFCFKFSLKQLLEIQAINFQLKVELLIATLSAVIKQRKDTNTYKQSELIDRILSARIIKTQKADQQKVIFISFGDKQFKNQGKCQQTQSTNTVYKLNSSLTLLQTWQNQPRGDGKAYDSSFILIFSQKQLNKLNRSQRYFEAFKIKLNDQKTSVIVSASIYKQSNQHYEQQKSVELFLKKSNLQKMIDKNGSCDLLWYYPHQYKSSQHVVSSVTHSLTNILKYFNLNCKKTNITEKQQFKQNSNQRPSTIQRLAKVQYKEQNVTIEVNTALLFRQSQFHQLLKEMLFNSQFKEQYLSGLVQQLKKSEKLEFKYAYYLSLLLYANGSPHFQQLKQFLKPFSQNAAYLIAKINMLANDFFYASYNSKTKLAKKLYTNFMDNLQKMGNYIFKQIQQRFTLKGSKLQQQYFSNKIYFGKVNLHKFYQTRQNVIEICNMHKQQLRHIKQVLDKYRDLFVFIAVFSSMLGYISTHQKLNILVL